MTATVAVIGLGYVGLPLVVEFGKRFRTIGFDISAHKVESCLAGVDPSRELQEEQMRAAVHAEYTADPKSLGAADIIIVTYVHGDQSYHLKPATVCCSTPQSFTAPAN